MPEQPKMDKIGRENLRRLITEHCVVRTKLVKLSSGGTSNVYVDLRRLTLSPAVQEIVANLRDVLRNTFFDYIGGPSEGANQIIGAFMATEDSFSTRQGFVVRKEEKTHGLEGRVAGCEIPRDARVVMVEDVTTSGQSLLDACTVAICAGADVVYAISIMDREVGARELFEQVGIPFTSLVKLSELCLPDSAPDATTR